MGEITCVDGVRLGSAREVQEISAARVGSRGEIRAMREVRARREVQKRNGLSQDRRVACMREIRRAGKAAAVLKSCDAGRGFDSGSAMRYGDERRRLGTAVQGSDINGMVVHAEGRYRDARPNGSSRVTLAR
jgi:hypothetical protein